MALQTNRIALGILWSGKCCCCIGRFMLSLRLRNPGCSVCNLRRIGAMSRNNEPANSQQLYAVFSIQAHRSWPRRDCHRYWRILPLRSRT